MKHALLLAFAVLALALPRPAKAADLPAILSAGTIRIGTQMDNPPFGYIDAAGKPAGFDVEFGEMLGRAMGVKVEVVQLIGANRIPFLLTNKIDVVVSAMGATPQRATQVMFTTPYAALYLGVYGPKTLAVKAPGDLGTYKIASTKGTTQDQALTEVAPRAAIVRFDDDTAANTAFLSGQAELWATLNTVASSISAKSPEKGIELKFKLRDSPAHMAVRQGDFQLQHWLDTFIFFVKANGQLQGLHRKWLNEDMGTIPVL